MRLTTCSYFPNREIRVVTTRQRLSSVQSHRETHETSEGPDSLPSPPTCHSRKTRNATRKPPQTGSLSIEGRPGWGGLGRFHRFSNYARRQLLRAGGALERTAPHEECLFFTLTLPGSTVESMEAIARYSSRLVHGFKAWIAKRLPSKLDMYCWEWQKRGALHLHYVVHCPDRAVGESLRAGCKAEWIRLLDAVGKDVRIDMYAKSAAYTHAENKSVTRTDAQWCKKSVAAYLSKYVSKRETKGFAGASKMFAPARWYGISRPLLARLRELTLTLRWEYGAERDAWGAYEEIAHVLASDSIKCYEWSHRIGDGKTIVAYVEDSVRESVWTQVRLNMRVGKDLFMSTEENTKQVVLEGISVMSRLSSYKKEFWRICSDYMRRTVSRLLSSEHCTALDVEMVLDTLIFTCEYIQATRCPLPGALAVWYRSAIVQQKAALNHRVKLMLLDMEPENFR